MQELPQNKPPRLGLVLNEHGSCLLPVSVETGRKQAIDGNVDKLGMIEKGGYPDHALCFSLGGYKWGDCLR